MSRVGGAPPFKNYFIGRASSGRDRNLRSNTDSQHSSRSALCSKSRVFLKFGAAPEELAAFNIWPSLNIEPTSSQISEETLESLKLCERNSRKNFERQSAPSKTTEGHPQSDVTQRRAEFPQATQRHFNLKASIKQPLKWLNRVVLYL